MERSRASRCRLEQEAAFRAAGRREEATGARPRLRQIEAALQHALQDAGCPRGIIRLDSFAGTAPRTVRPLADSGARLVRCGWFLAFVRRETDTYNAATLDTQMARVGWQRSGGEGKVKATAPDGRRTLNWHFYTVPKGREERRAQVPEYPQVDIDRARMRAHTHV